MTNPRNEQLLQLIEKEDDLTISFARNKNALQELILQIKFNLVNESNKDDIGNVIFAFKQIEMIFDDVVTRGEAVLAQRKKDLQKKNIE